MHSLIDNMALVVGVVDTCLHSGLLQKPQAPMSDNLALFGRNNF